MSPGPASSIELNSLFDQDLLWVQAGDAVELLEKRLNATRGLVNKVSCAVQVSKKGYVDLVYQLAGEVKEGHWISTADRREFTESDRKIEKLI